MAVNGTETVGQLVEDALLEIEAHTLGQTVDSAQQAHAIRIMQRMLKGWQQEHGTPAHLIAEQTHTVSGVAAQVLDPVRPLRIISCNFKRDGIEIPMLELTRREYDDLPEKDTQGTPTQFYYHRRTDDAILYIWPLLSPVNGETLEITYERETDDIASASDVIDLPVEWYEAAVYGLAVRLCGTYGKPGLRGDLAANARGAFDRAMGAGIDGTSVEFKPCRS